MPIQKAMQEIGSYCQHHLELLFICYLSHFMQFHTTIMSFKDNRAISICLVWIARNTLVSHWLINKVLGFFSVLGQISLHSSCPTAFSTITLNTKGELKNDIILEFNCGKFVFREQISCIDIQLSHSIAIRLNHCLISYSTQR